VCVCVCARARACVCVCVRQGREEEFGHSPQPGAEIQTMPSERTGTTCVKKRKISLCLWL